MEHKLGINKGTELGKSNKQTYEKIGAWAFPLADWPNNPKSILIWMVILPPSRNIGDNMALKRYSQYLDKHDPYLDRIGYWEVTPKGTFFVLLLVKHVIRIEFTDARSKMKYYHIKLIVI